MRRKTFASTYGRRSLKIAPRNTLFFVHCEINTLTISLRALAKRWLALADELRELDAVLEDLPHQHSSRPRAQFGIGHRNAAILISVAGDNPERLRSEAALAALCGVSPLEASSGKTVRHRLNRDGDRYANNTLWTITMVRMRGDPRTQAYVESRTQEGNSTLLEALYGPGAISIRYGQFAVLSGSALT